MRAIILAAGQGSRLRPLTNNLPKTMIKLFGKTLLQNQILTLREMGVGEITVISGFCSDLIKGDDINIVKNNNFETTNMVSSLFCASHMFNDESDIIIAYGDIIYEKRILEELFSCNSSISLTADLDWEKLWKVRLDNPLSDAETFKIDSFGFIKELGKKPNSYREVEAQYMGLIKINSGYQRSLLQYYLSLDKSNKYDGNSFDNMYMTSFIQGLIDNSWKVSSVLVNGGWLEIDTLNDFKIYNTMYDKGTLSKYYKYE